MNDNGHSGTTKWLRVYGDHDGGLVAIEYQQDLTIGQAAAVAANVLKDAIGDTPTLQDIAAVQASLMAALNGQ